MSRIPASRTPVVASAALVLACLAAGCAPAGKRVVAPAPAARPAVQCDEASGEATMGSVASARYFARTSLEHNLGRSRNFLSSQGALRMRVVSRDMLCQAYPLPIPGARTRCVATARICSR